MLYSLSADRASFKTIEFREGLNIILVDRQIPTNGEEKSPQQRRTRNGAGKSSLIDLVHFLLAGDAEGALKSKELADWVFELTLDVGDERLAVRRGLSGSRLSIRREGPGFVESAEAVETNAAWTRRLGRAWFQLNGNRQPGAASFRQLFSYFARRRRDGGYDDPVRTFRAQSNAVSETNLALLFGLDAEVVRRFHQAKNALKQVQTAQKALRDLEKNAPAGTRRVDLEATLSAQIVPAPSRAIT
jgi:uncharacterized protein YydD (DUF2326 family)